MTGTPKFYLSKACDWAYSNRGKIAKAVAVSAVALAVVSALSPKPVSALAPPKEMLATMTEQLTLFIRAQFETNLRDKPRFFCNPKHLTEAYESVLPQNLVKALGGDDSMNLAIFKRHTAPAIYQAATATIKELWTDAHRLLGPSFCNTAAEL